ncbi:MAG: amino acid-binding protein [Verrucomicrobia bacterium]|nr:amino acid-binding protein [Verrucomicrobiota bacterium]
MKIQQLSLFLENKPGHLSAICKTLARANLSIVTLSLADTQQFGILRLILADWEKAKEVLEAKGFVVNTTEVVATEIEDRPGGLADLLQTIEESKINIEYMYAFTFRRGNRAILIFRFDNPDAAVKVLQSSGKNVLGSVDLFEH